jgi:hypothetical protein
MGSWGFSCPGEPLKRDFPVENGGVGDENAHAFRCFGRQITAKKERVRCSLGVSPGCWGGGSVVAREMGGAQAMSGSFWGMNGEAVKLRLYDGPS